MLQFNFGKVSLADLKQVVNLRPQGMGEFDWLRIDRILLSDYEQQRLDDLRRSLSKTRSHLLNEATIWSRVIYPLLALAEQGTVQAWAQVNLSAKYDRFSIEGVADGVMGQSIDGYLETHYFVVVKAKRGIEAENPQFQLYGQLLAAARLNWQNDDQDPQEIFGCYTIADVWTFYRAEVQALESDRPTMILESSREFSEAQEAEVVFKILKGIVSRKLGTI